MRYSSVLSASKIFLDSSPLIYWIEGHPLYAPLLEPLFQDFATGKKSAFSSVLTLIEVLVSPLRKKQQDLVSRYEDILLHDPNFELIRIEHVTCLQAAQYRSKYNVKVPDAIQLATAQLQNADIFLTNDENLKKVREVPVAMLSDYVRQP